MPSKKNSKKVAASAHATASPRHNGDDNQYDVKAIVHFVFYNNGQIYCLVQWEGYEGHPDEFGWVTLPNVSPDALTVEWNNRGMNPVTAMNELKEKFVAHRVLHGFEMAEYKEFALEMAKAGKLFELKKLLVPPSVTKSNAQAAPPLSTTQTRTTAPAKASYQATAQASALESIAEPMTKAEPKPAKQPMKKPTKKQDKTKPQLGRRKSLRLREQLKIADNQDDDEAVTQETFTKPPTALKSILRKPDTGFKDVQPLDRTTAHGDDDKKAEVQVLTKISTKETLHASSIEDPSAERNKTRPVESKPNLKQLRPRKSLSVAVDANGSPMPDLPAFSSPLAQVATVNQTSTPQMTAEDVKENMAPPENRKTQEDKAAGHRKKRMSVFDWLADLRII